MVDLSSSSDEEGLIHDTSRDEEFARKLFGDLNDNILLPPGDGNIIILSDSDEAEKEAREENSGDTKDATASATINPISTASVDDIGTPIEKSSTPAASPADSDEA